jgi:hypothetical protein
MANWSSLRAALAAVDERVTFAWPDLNELVGGLPASAYKYAAFWKGDRSGWPGFTTADVRVGQSITFVRRHENRSPTQAGPLESALERQSAVGSAVDLVLVGCVKSKLNHAAPAQDLYTSPLFRKERTYAAATGAPWFVLSAKHGVVAPTTVLQPYDLRLSNTPQEYRSTWGIRVVKQLKEAVGPLAGILIEVHAGSAYTDAIRDLLLTDGAVVKEPLRGLTMGERLAWYDRDGNSAASAVSTKSAIVDPSFLIEELGTNAKAIAPADFIATNGAGLRTPGLYSWWCDQEGAATLSAGLGHTVQPGLLYAGLAGATRARSGRESTNTLWGRIRGMHLGGRHGLSTFRLSLGSILANARNEVAIDEDRLTIWMHAHLRLVAVPVADADELNGLETVLLVALNPPLNLDKMPRSPLRERLTELRRIYRGRA